MSLIVTEGQSLTVTGNLVGANVLATNETRLTAVEDKAIFDQVNVKDYGAIYDGTTDAYSALVLSMAAGESIYITGDILVGSDITIDGFVFLENGSIKPDTGVTITIASTCYIRSNQDWQDDSLGSFVIQQGACEERVLTKSVSTSGYSVNSGNITNDIQSSACYVKGGTTSYPHSIGTDSELSIIGGAYDNHIGDNATASTISGGAHHNIEDDASHAAIGGGSTHTVNGSYGFVGGGFTNRAHSTYSVIGGGQNNITGDVSGASIDTRSAFVGAGAVNTAKGLRSGIVSGSTNTASGEESFIGSGSNNLASGTESFIGGGSSNESINDASAVIAGVDNTASGIKSLAHGESATASGDYSMAIGEFLEASGSGSIAFGRRSKAVLRGQRAFASGYFSSKGDAQLSDLVARKQTSTATPALLDLYGTTSSYPILIPDNTTWMFEINLVARRTDSDGENAAYKFIGAIKKDGTSASTSLVGSVTKTVVAEDMAAWDADVTANTSNGSMSITVTGEAGKTIRWVGRISLTEVSG